MTLRNFMETFEDDVEKRYGCEMHYFDLEVSLRFGPSRSTGVTLHKIQLSSEDGRTPNNWKVRTLASIKEELHHSQQIDILKVDIEENEWRTLPQLLASDSLVLVRQLLIELHVMTRETTEPSKEDYIRYMTILRDLHINGFRIAKTTADKERRLSSFGESRPYNYEVLFLRSGI